MLYDIGKIQLPDREKLGSRQKMLYYLAEKTKSRKFALHIAK